MSYLEFKLSLEMAYVSTFERDNWVQEQYKKYLDNHKGYARVEIALHKLKKKQKKREDKLNPPKNPLIVKKANNPNTSR